MSSSSIDWERWIGVRGAAVVGSIALVLAGLFFVQVAIERGWLGPAARDLLALGVGALALIAHGPLRKRKLLVFADSVAGAGTVLMYAGAWAAARLHDLVPPSVALLVMAGTTGTALLIAMRANAPIVATFALVGGFATPMLLGTMGSDSTTMLFGYLLVLDLALLVLARFHGWKFVVPSALFGTLLLQFAWSRESLFEPMPLWVAAVVGSTGALIFTYALLSARDPRPQGKRDGPTASLLAVALISPFALLGHRLFGAVPADTPLWIITAFCAILSCAAAVSTVHFRTGFYLVGSGAASALLVAAFKSKLEIPTGQDAWTWSGQHGFDLWSLNTAALAIVFLIIAAVTQRRSLDPNPRRGASGLYTFALLSIFPCSFIGLAGHGPDPTSGAFIGTVACLLLLGLHGARFSPAGRFAPGLMGFVAGGVIASYHWYIYEAADHGQWLFWSMPMLSVGLVVLAHGLGRGRGLALASASSAAAASAILPSFFNAIELVERGPVAGLALGAAVAVAFSVAITWPVVERKSKVGVWVRQLAIFTAACGVAAVIARLSDYADGQWRYSYLRPSHASLTLVCLAVLVAALPVATTIRARRGFHPGASVLKGEHGWLRARCWAAALPALFLLLRPSQLGAMLWSCSAGDPAFTETLLSGSLRHGLLIAGAAVVALPSLFVDRRDRPSALAGFAVAATLASTGLARIFASQGTIVGATLAFGAVATLASRAKSAHLALTTAAAALVPVVGLMITTFVGGAFLATDALVPLQLTIDFGLALMGTGAAYLALGEPALHEDDAELLSVLRYSLAAGFLALLFGWMNAAVLNQFAAPGESIRMMNERLQARDLTISISWGTFAGALLAYGMVTRSAPLRWTSLWLFLAFILKVFLYDLSALTGLSRVASFLGLAVSLLGVSLLYARVLGTGGDQVDNLRDHDASRSRRPEPPEGGVTDPTE